MLEVGEKNTSRHGFGAQCCMKRPLQWYKTALSEQGAVATWSQLGSIQPGRYRSRF